MGRSPHFRASVPPREGDPHGQLAWRRLRRGIADLHRRAEVSRRATERYLDVLASIDQDTTLETVLHRLGQPRALATQPLITAPTPKAASDASADAPEIPLEPTSAKPRTMTLPVWLAAKTWPKAM